MIIANSVIECVRRSSVQAIVSTYLSTGDRTPLFTLENCNGDMVLTTEIRDENSEIIAKINKNEFVRIKENFDKYGEIKKGNGLTLIRKEDGKAIFNVKITEDQYVEVSGTFYVGGNKIHITDRTVEINDTPGNQ